MLLSPIKFVLLAFAIFAASLIATAQQPAEVIDSLAAAAAKKVLQTKETIKSDVKQIASQGNQAGKQLIGIGKEQLDSLLQPGKQLAQLVSSKINLFKPGGQLVKFNGLAADFEYNYIDDTSGLYTGLQQNVKGVMGYNITTGLSMANMPFDGALRGNNGIYSFDHTPFSNFSHFNFNHKKYLEELQKAVLEKVNPEKVLATVMSRINTIRGQYEKSLKVEVEKMQSDFVSEFKKGITIPSDISDLSVADLASLKNKLIPAEVIEKYKSGTERYAEIIKNPDIKSVMSDSITNDALADIKKFEVLQKMFEKITAWKAKFENNSTVKELKSHLPFTPGNFKSFLRKPGNLQQVIKEHANLSSIQKLFMNVTKLDIGNNPLQAGELSLQNIMNTGINTEIQNAKRSFGFLYGSGGANVNNFQQMGLNSFVTNEFSKVSGFKFGSGYGSAVKQSVSINFFDFNTSPDVLRSDNPNLQSQYLSAPVRRDAVITWQSGFTIAENHKLSVDLSKSFGGYRNNLSEDSLPGKSNPYGDIFNSSGKSNYAATVDYSGTVLKTPVEVYLKKVGLGYSNPGSVFLRKGETRIGIGVNRKVLKQKATIKYKIDYRNQHFDPSKNNTYSNITNQLQLSYRLSRNNRLGLTYRRSDYKLQRLQQAPSSGFSSALQATGNYMFRAAGKKVINNFMLGTQHFEIPTLVGNNYVSRTFLLNHSTSVLINKNLLTATFSVNQSDNKDYYFNTSSLNSELGYSYALSEKISLNSGFGYYANTGWNKQLGIKQQISGTLFNKLDFDIDISYKKAIQIIRPELANQVFVSSSVHYRF
jgi:hypothetical protein